MTRRLTAAGLTIPTAAQFAMILSDAPVTRVVAGAGSGKSTTLVMRCLAMHVYHAIPWSAMTVVTFTRNSRKDFMRKLAKAARAWDIALSERELLQVVRTFHSLAFSQAQAAMLPVNTIDGIGGASGAGMSGKNEGSHPGGDLGRSFTDLPFPPLAIPEDGDLAILLNEIACQLMRDDPAFREAVMKLYDASFLASSAAAGADPVRDKRIGAVQAHDQARTRHLADLWRTEIAPQLMRQGIIEFEPTQFVTGAIREGKERDVANGPWWANGYLPEMGAWVLLGATPASFQGRVMPDGFPVGAALAAKKSCVNVLTSAAPVIWLNTPEDLMRLHHRLRWEPETALEFPKFNVKLRGETSAVPLLVAFWQQAQFIQSLGLSVQAAAQAATKGALGVDAHFARALAQFWPAFESGLANRTLTTTNGVFAQLSDPGVLASMPDSALACCKHLMIDEFQDISGNIVQWLVNAQHAIQARGATTSLMVVGDDWQSIYGWRGASPRYFTRFDQYFRPVSADGQVHTLVLNENFRSSQRIIDAAQLMISGVNEKVEKSGIALGDNAQLTTPVHLIVCPEGTPLPAAVGEPLLADSCFVLARTNVGLAQLDFGDASRMTIHGSKGLEADYVVLVEDFAAPVRHPLRATWYRLAGLGDYDAAQRDETHRLAYVAITRARKGCVWYVREPVADGMFGILAENESPAVRQLVEA